MAHEGCSIVRQPIAKHAQCATQELCAKIMEGRYTVPEALSPAAKDLLARMLTVDPERRITFEQVRRVCLLSGWA